MITVKKFVNEVACLSAHEIESSMADNCRQYIQGNLQIPQNLPFILNTRSEIGISYYREFTHDDPHYHDEITETNYVLEGKVCLKVLDTGAEYVIEKGGIFSIPPRIVHVFKAQPETKILFMKDHALNDKHVVDPDPLNLENWLNDKEF